MEERELHILRGIHPGIVLERKLKERKLVKGKFALSIHEHPQILGAITKGKRGMNTSLALRIEHALNLPEGFFMTLQVYYEIREEKRRLSATNRPDLSRIRPALFWDVDISKIDWQRQRRAVIQRIVERGNEDEKAEITRFYGEPVIHECLTTNA